MLFIPCEHDKLQPSKGDNEIKKLSMSSLDNKKYFRESTDLAKS